MLEMGLNHTGAILAGCDVGCMNKLSLVTMIYLKDLKGAKSISRNGGYCDCVVSELCLLCYCNNENLVMSRSQHGWGL